MKFEFWKSRVWRQWHWHLKAANGEVIAAGEGYRKKADMLAAIDLVKQSAKSPVRLLKKYR